MFSIEESVRDTRTESTCENKFIFTPVTKQGCPHPFFGKPMSSGFHLKHTISMDVSNWTNAIIFRMSTWFRYKDAQVCMTISVFAIYRREGWRGFIYFTSTWRRWLGFTGGCSTHEFNTRMWKTARSDKEKHKNTSSITYHLTCGDMFPRQIKQLFNWSRQLILFNCPSP